MRPYFHAGEEAKGTTDLQRAEAIAVYLPNAMDFVFVHLGTIDDAGKAVWVRYFAYVFQNSPVLRDFLEEHKDWYGGHSRSTSRGSKPTPRPPTPFFFGSGGQFGPPR
jgi:hypothetical protein